MQKQKGRNEWFPLCDAMDGEIVVINKYNRSCHSSWWVWRMNGAARARESKWINERVAREYRQTFHRDILSNWRIQIRISLGCLDTHCGHCTQSHRAHSLCAKPKSTYLRMKYGSAIMCIKCGCLDLNRIVSNQKRIQWELIKFSNAYSVCECDICAAQTVNSARMFIVQSQPWTIGKHASS